MHSRWFNITVVVAWLVTMSWLVTEKVLPPMLLGEPPSYSKIIEAEDDAPPTGWKISADGRSIGWALTDVERQPTGLTEIYGRVHFDHLPLGKLMTGWIEPLARLFVKLPDSPTMDARSVLVISPFGRLERFDSAVALGPGTELVNVHGTVEGKQVQLLVRAGDVNLPAYYAPLPANALLSDALTPQTHLPGLKAGQTWTVPIYSPLPSKQPLEVIRATVEGEEPLFWNGKMETALLVVYRSESGISALQAPKGRLWVRSDGLVLQQQAVFFDLELSFVRMTDKEAEAQVESAGEHWWNLNLIPGGSGR